VTGVDEEPEGLEAPLGVCEVEAVRAELVRAHPAHTVRRAADAQLEKGGLQLGGECISGLDQRGASQWLNDTFHLGHRARGCVELLLLGLRLGLGVLGVLLLLEIVLMLAQWWLCEMWRDRERGARFSA
jgi:hypothetical protein